MRTYLVDTPFTPRHRPLEPSGIMLWWMRLVSGRLYKTRTRYLRCFVYFYLSHHETKWYGPQTLNDGFFRMPSRAALAPGTHLTGRTLCAAAFRRSLCLDSIESPLMQPSAFQKRTYLAVGCTNGIYVGIRADSCEPSSITHARVTNSIGYSISESLGIYQPNFSGCTSRIQQVPRSM